MSLESILKDIHSYQPFANENVEDGPMETLNGRRGRKNQAIEQLRVLKAQYRTELLKSAVWIVVTGSESKEFETIATGEAFKLFASNPEQFYSDLANRVAPTLYLQKEGVSNLFDVLGRHLEDKMGELGAEQYNQLIFKEKYIKPIKNQAEFAAIVKEAINEQMGTEIVGIQSVTSILDDAIARNHSGRTTSILLPTNDDKLVLDLMRDLGIRGNRAVLVVAGKVPKALRDIQDKIVVKEVTETSVKGTLDTIKNSLRK
jgi:hypothetical protein